MFIGNVIDKDEFIQFCQEIYKDLLDDYCHFIQNHDHQLRNIRNSLIAQYQLKDCDIYSCKTIQRHYRSNTETTTPITIDTDLICSFYMDCFDRIHHQIYHLHKLGLRIEEISDDTQHDNVDEESAVVDKAFKRIKELIFKKRERFGSNRIQRLQNKHSKFNLSVEITQLELDGVCFLDGIYDILKENKTLRDFLQSHEYDSDAFIEDLSGTISENTSNLFKISRYKSHISSLTNYIHHYICYVLTISYKHLHDHTFCIL